VNPSFQKIFDLIEHQRADILEQVKNVPTEKFNYCPPGKWSIAQILAHILTAETLSLGYMKKKIQAVDQLKNSGLSEAIRYRLLQLSQRIPSLKFRAPKVVVDNTPPSMDIQTLIVKWDAQRKELKEFLESIEDKNIRKVIYRHPIAGMLNARQAVGFFREHIIHHRPQIKRLCK
jgi:uncharacterized damage-inducible protein DinB